MARAVQVQGYTIYACEQCRFAYKEPQTADQCALYDLEHGERSFDVTGKSIAPPDRYYQAVLKFMEEEQKAAKARAAAAAKAAAPAAGATGPGAAAPAAPAARPALTPEEVEARKKAAAAKAAKQAQGA